MKYEQYEALKEAIEMLPSMAALIECLPSAAEQRQHNEE